MSDWAEELKERLRKQQEERAKKWAEFEAKMKKMQEERERYWKEEFPKQLQQKQEEIRREIQKKIEEGKRRAAEAQRKRDEYRKKILRGEVKPKYTKPKPVDVTRPERIVEQVTPKKPTVTPAEDKLEEAKRVLKELEERAKKAAEEIRKRPPTGKTYEQILKEWGLSEEKLAEIEKELKELPTKIPKEIEESLKNAKEELEKVREEAKKALESGKLVRYGVSPKITPTVEKPEIKAPLAPKLPTEYVPPENLKKAWEDLSKREGVEPESIRVVYWDVHTPKASSPHIKEFSNPDEAYNFIKQLEKEGKWYYSAEVVYKTKELTKSVTTPVTTPKEAINKIENVRSELSSPETNIYANVEHLAVKVVEPDGKQRIVFLSTGNDREDFRVMQELKKKYGVKDVTYIVGYDRFKRVLEELDKEGAKVQVLESEIKGRPRGITAGQIKAAEFAPSPEAVARPIEEYKREKLETLKKATEFINEQLEAGVPLPNALDKVSRKYGSDTLNNILKLHGITTNYPTLRAAANRYEDYIKAGRSPEEALDAVRKAYGNTVAEDLKKVYGIKVAPTPALTPTPTEEQPYVASVSTDTIREQYINMLTSIGVPRDDAERVVSSVLNKYGDKIEVTGKTEEEVREKFRKEMVNVDSEIKRRLEGISPTVARRLLSLPTPIPREEYGVIGRVKLTPEEVEEITKDIEKLQEIPGFRETFKTLMPEELYLGKVYDVEWVDERGVKHHETFKTLSEARNKVKELQESGITAKLTEREPEWYETPAGEVAKAGIELLPGGMAAMTIYKAAKGKPVSKGDWAWAAFDIGASVFPGAEIAGKLGRQTNKLAKLISESDELKTVVKELAEGGEIAAKAPPRSQAATIISKLRLLGKEDQLKAFNEALEKGDTKTLAKIVEEVVVKKRGINPEEATGRLVGLVDMIGIKNPNAVSYNIVDIAKSTKSIKEEKALEEGIEELVKYKGVGKKLLEDANAGKFDKIILPSGKSLKEVVLESVSKAGSDFNALSPGRLVKKAAEVAPKEVKNVIEKAPKVVEEVNKPIEDAVKELYKAAEVGDVLNVAKKFGEPSEDEMRLFGNFLSRAKGYVEKGNYDSAIKAIKSLVEGRKTGKIKVSDEFVAKAIRETLEPVIKEGKAHEIPEELIKTAKEALEGAKPIVKKEVKEAVEAVKPVTKEVDDLLRDANYTLQRLEAAKARFKRGERAILEKTVDSIENALKAGNYNKVVAKLHELDEFASAGDVSKKFLLNVAKRTLSFMKREGIYSDEVVKTLDSILSKFRPVVPLTPSEVSEAITSVVKLGERLRGLSDESAKILDEMSKAGIKLKPGEADEVKKVSKELIKALDEGRIEDVIKILRDIDSGVIQGKYSPKFLNTAINNVLEHAKSKNILDEALLDTVDSLLHKGRLVTKMVSEEEIPVSRYAISTEFIERLGYKSEDELREGLRKVTEEIERSGLSKKITDEAIAKYGLNRVIDLTDYREAAIRIIERSSLTEEAKEALKSLVRFDPTEVKYSATETRDLVYSGMRYIRSASNSYELKEGYRLIRDAIEGGDIIEIIEAFKGMRIKDIDDAIRNAKVLGYNDIEMTLEALKEISRVPLGSKTARILRAKDAFGKLYKKHGLFRVRFGRATLSEVDILRGQDLLKIGLKLAVSEKGLTPEEVQWGAKIFNAFSKADNLIEAPFKFTEEFMKLPPSQKIIGKIILASKWFDILAMVGRRFGIEFTSIPGRVARVVVGTFFALHSAMLFIFLLEQTVEAMHWIPGIAYDYFPAQRVKQAKSMLYEINTLSKDINSLRWEIVDSIEKGDYDRARNAARALKAKLEAYINAVKSYNEFLERNAGEIDVPGYIDKPPYIPCIPLLCKTIEVYEDGKWKSKEVINVYFSTSKVPALMGFYEYYKSIADSLLKDAEYRTNGLLSLDDDALAREIYIEEVKQRDFKVQNVRYEVEGLKDNKIQVRLTWQTPSELRVGDKYGLKISKFEILDSEGNVIATISGDKAEVAPGLYSAVIGFDADKYRDGGYTVVRIRYTLEAEDMLTGQKQTFESGLWGTGVRIPSVNDILSKDQVYKRTQVIVTGKTEQGGTAKISVVDVPENYKVVELVVAKPDGTIDRIENPAGAIDYKFDDWGRYSIYAVIQRPDGTTVTTYSKDVYVKESEEERAKKWTPTPTVGFEVYPTTTTEPTVGEPITIKVDDPNAVVRIGTDKVLTGKTEYTFIPDKTGTLTITIEKEDEEGRKVTKSTTLYVKSSPKADIFGIATPPTGAQVGKPFTITVGDSNYKVYVYEGTQVKELTGKTEYEYTPSSAGTISVVVKDDKGNFVNQQNVYVSYTPRRHFAYKIVNPSSPDEPIEVAVTAPEGVDASKYKAKIIYVDKEGERKEVEVPIGKVYDITGLPPSSSGKILVEVYDGEGNLVDSEDLLFYVPYKKTTTTKVKSVSRGGYSKSYSVPTTQYKKKTPPPEPKDKWVKVNQEIYDYKNKGSESSVSLIDIIKDVKSNVKGG